MIDTPAKLISIAIGIGSVRDTANLRHSGRNRDAAGSRCQGFEIVCGIYGRTILAEQFSGDRVRFCLLHVICELRCFDAINLSARPALPKPIVCRVKERSVLYDRSAHVVTEFIPAKGWDGSLKLVPVS